MKYMNLAFRNIWRSPRRTILTLISLVAGISIMFIGLGWIRGYHTIMYKGIQELETGQVQLLTEKYFEEKRKFPLDETIQNASIVSNELNNMPELTAAARLEFPGIVRSSSIGIPVLIRGIDPDLEAKMSLLDDHIEQGSWIQNGILLGRTLAEKLKVGIGDSLSVRIGSDRFGNPNFMYVQVEGIFFLGYDPVDSGIAVLTLETAQSLVQSPDSASKILIKSGNEAQAVKIAEEYLSGKDIQLKVFSWKNFAQALVTTIEADSGGFVLMIAIIILLIVLGILNTSSMTIYERLGEFSTLRAIGFKKKQIRYLLLSESIVISLIAGFFGLLIGGTIAWYLSTVGIDFQDFLPEGFPMPFGNRFTADFRIQDVFWSFFTGISATILGQYFPLRRLEKISISSGLSGKGW
jgi:putative ABC transport system permease protein